MISSDFPTKIIDLLLRCWQLDPPKSKYILFFIHYIILSACSYLKVLKTFKTHISIFIRNLTFTNFYYRYQLSAASNHLTPAQLSLLLLDPKLSRAPLFTPIHEFSISFKPFLVNFFHLVNFSPKKLPIFGKNRLKGQSFAI